MREIESESRTRIRQFIRNKEVGLVFIMFMKLGFSNLKTLAFQVAMVTANVTLPTLVLPSAER